MTTKELILRHLSFAEGIAKKQFKKTPPQVSLDELISAAYLGLVDAANRFDGKRDFKPFASFRIIGEIKDYLRSLQWDRHNVKVAAIPEDFDIAAEPEAENFDDVLDEITKDNVSPMVKSVFRMYYGECLPIVKIAEKVNLSGARISQIINSNLKTLQTSLCA
jgi:RNA polymerase sigma factor (sigma-70 family)